MDMFVRIAPLTVLLAVGCKPQTAELTAGDYFAFMSEATSFSLLKGSVDPEKWKDDQRFVVDCRDFGTKKENDVLKLPDPLKICKKWEDGDGDGHPAPEVEAWMGQGGFHVLTEPLEPWRGEAVITAENDLQLSFHHRIPGGSDFRFSIVVDPDFQPTECAVEGDGAKPQNIDGNWLENWTQDLRNLEDDADGDGWPNSADCAPDDADVFPCNDAELENDGFDSDCDERDEAREDKCGQPGLSEGHAILADHIDSGTLWYLNARGFQLDPADPEDTFWSIPEHYRAGFAAGKFADEDFHTRAPRWGDSVVYDAVENELGVSITEDDLFYIDPNNYPGSHQLEDLLNDPIDADGDSYSSEVDCDDNNPNINPSVWETCDGVDEDCDERIDDGLSCADDDFDGYCEDANCTDGSLPGDCDDSYANTFPGGTELADGKDNDCDGDIDNGRSTFDDDGDGFTEDGGDCDDNDAAVNPGAVEVCDGVDNNCEGTIDETTECFDDDGDGYTEVDGDCDDSDAAVNEDAIEDNGNDIDDDCDGTIDGGDTDADGDGFTADGAGLDCDDGDPTAYPGALELPNGVDNDCDGVVDNDTVDFDDDGDGFTENEGDCNDNDDQVNPDENEGADGIDENCDGTVDEGTDAYDDDGDGFTEDGDDCDDDDPDVNPNALETIDGGDEDCDGDVDEGTDVTDDDGDGYSEDDGDLDDRNSSVFPNAQDCRNNVDDDNDGDIDEDGYDCAYWPMVNHVKGVADKVEDEWADVNVTYKPMVHDNYWRVPDGYAGGLDGWAGLHYNYITITGKIEEGEEISGAFNLVLDGDDSNSRFFISGQFTVPKIKGDKWTTEDLRAIKLEENGTSLCVENQ